MVYLTRGFLRLPQIIGVKKRHVLAGCPRQSRVESCRLSQILLSHGEHAVAEALGDRRRTVRRAIVDDNHIEGGMGLSHHAFDCLAEIARTVEDGNNGAEPMV